MFHAFQLGLGQIPDIVNGWCPFDLVVEDILGPVSPDKRFACDDTPLLVILAGVTPKLWEIVFKVRSLWLKNVEALLERFLGIKKFHVLPQYWPPFEMIRSFSRSFIIKLSILLIE